MARLGTQVVRVVVVAGLAVDVYVHLHLAHRYSLASSAGIGEGNLFRIEAALALIALLLVLFRPSVWSYALAAVVALGGTAAVLLYRYANVPAIGPIPSMYEPIWFFEKTLSAVAETIAGLAALFGILLSQQRRTRAAREPIRETT